MSDTTMAIVAFFASFILIPLGLSFICAYFKSIKRKKADTILSQITEFEVSKKHYGDNVLVAIDKNLEKVCIIDFKKALSELSIDKINVRQHFRFIEPKDILKVELFEDGNSVNSSTRSIGGAILGGALFGGVGAIVGGLGGSSESKSTANTIEIRLIVNDKENPICDIDFLDMKSHVGIEKTSQAYISCAKEARIWYGYFEVMVKNN
ncbi:hypothetical protein ACERCG_06550 [Mannheimia sp. E30BD]|uniref:hypothetical protein n=1 Tax=Mannheimia sp. E30BD TaxID=3278708 RepID=UPI00359E74CC